MKYYEHISSFSRRHPLLVITLIAVVILLSLYVILTSRLESDVTRLIPLHGEKTSLYFRTMEKFGNIERLYIIFSAPNINDHLSEIDRIGNEIKTSHLIKEVEWKLGKNMKVFLRDIFSKKAVLFLSDNEMKEFLMRLTDEGIEKELKKTRQRLNLPAGQGTLARIDPLNISEIFSRQIKFTDVPFDITSGYFITPDGKNLIMLVTPQGSPRDISFSKNLIEMINSVIKKNSSMDLKVDITGSYPITLYEASAMKKDILKNIITSLVGVTIIFLFFFRSLRVLFYAILPVAASIIATAGLMIFISGSVTEVVGAFAGLLIGLGIDLGIIFYVRYANNIKGFAHDAAIEQSIKHTGMGITIAVLTTAVTFYSMSFSSFRGARELGILTGTGILFTWLFLWSLIPVIIKPSVGQASHVLTDPEGTALEKFFGWSYRKPYPIILMTSLVTLLFIWFIPSVQIKGDIADLGTKDNPYRAIFENLQQNYIKTQGFIITGNAKDPDDAVQKSLMVKEALKNKIDHIFTPGDILPPLSKQLSNIKALESVKPDTVVKGFKQKAKEMGFNVSFFNEYLNRLSGLLRNKDTIGINELGPTKNILDRFLKKEGEDYTFLITGNLKKGVPTSVTKNVISNFKSQISNLSYTGPSFVKEELLNILRRDAIIITVIGLVFVNIVLYLDFRKSFYVLLCQLPVFISIIWVFSIMGFFKIDFNFMNATMFVMLFGIGTDYTIHLIHRYKEDDNIDATMHQTGRAIVIAGITTIVAFGSIGLSAYRGLASMGIVVGLGITFCMLLSLSLIPAVLRLYEKRLERIQEVEGSSGQVKSRNNHWNP